MEVKQLYGYFYCRTGVISNEKTRKWLRKGNLKRESDSLLKPTRNITVSTNYTKVKINNINKIISEGCVVAKTQRLIS